MASREIVLEVAFVAMSIAGEAYCMAYCMSVAVDQGTHLAIAVDMAVAAFHNLASQALLEEASIHTSSCFAASAGSDGMDCNQLAARSGVSIDLWSRQEFVLFCQSRVSFSYRVFQPSSFVSLTLILNRGLRHLQAFLGSSTS